MTQIIEDVNLRIREAYEILIPVVHHTPLTPFKTLSDMTGGEVLLKLENFQKTGAFKVRGAYYKLSKLKTRENISRVVAASSGNHAQGVAYSAAQLGIEATIFMPRYTPFYKVNATRSYSAKVVLYGDTYDDAYRKAIEVSESEKIPFIHPFEDLDIIAGQGTIGLEIFKDAPNIDIVLVPVGGGGLISGIAVALKKLNEKIKVIGVQPSGAPAMYLSYKQGRVTETHDVYSIADGVIVKKPGELTLKIMSEVVDDMVLVDDRDIARAVFLLLERAKTVAEPAGALSVAALLSGNVNVKGKRTVAVVSGGNVEPSLLARIINQTLFIEGRQVKIKGQLPDRPGQLKKVIDVVAELGLNIISIEHERINPLVAPGLAEVIIGLEVPNRDTINLLTQRLKELGLDFKVI
ncbi:MAG: threonine ammonia-lyase [Infirmifilum sp.]